MIAPALLSSGNSSVRTCHVGRAIRLLGNVFLTLFTGNWFLTLLLLSDKALSSGP